MAAELADSVHHPAPGKPSDSADRPASPGTSERTDLNVAQPGRMVRNQPDAGIGNTDAAATRSGQPGFKNTGGGRQQHQPAAVRALSAQSECPARSGGKRSASR